MNNPNTWWHNAICYQIYPKSFADSNNDGIGDLRGIIKKLPVLRDLGVDIVWLSPVYPSPMVDQGYDVADYCAIDPRFGTMDDFDALIAEADKLGLKILMDLVLNHCSDQHPWFKEAVKNPDGKYGEYFFIRRGKAAPCNHPSRAALSDRAGVGGHGMNGENERLHSSTSVLAVAPGAAAQAHPPNNLRAYFGGSAWDLVPGQNDLYYLHLFTSAQPDLNWDNPDVRQELLDIVRFWLDKGVGGFRLDAIINFQKPAYYQDKTTPLPDYPADSADGTAFPTQMLAEVPNGADECFAWLTENTTKPAGAFTVAELFGEPEERLAKVIGQKHALEQGSRTHADEFIPSDRPLPPVARGDKQPDGYFSTMFDFAPHALSFGKNGFYDAPDIDFKTWRDTIFKSQAVDLGGGFWSNILENHDQPRGVSRYLPPHMKDTDNGAKALATIFMFLRGIPWIYQGQELGMQNCRFASIDDYDDCETKNQYRLSREAGFSDADALEHCFKLSRDNCRTMMPWDADQAQKPAWLAVHPDCATRNVADQIADPNSVWQFYRTLIALRKEYSDLFTYGVFAPLMDETPAVFAYTRSFNHQTAVVAANFGETTVAVPFTGEALTKLGAPELQPGGWFVGLK